MLTLNEYLKKINVNYKKLTNEFNGISQTLSREL